MRGIAQFEEIQPGRGRRGRTAIVVTELPFQVNKASWIEKVADLVNQGRIEGISDIRDESDREGMRVVFELKREAQPQLILNELYRLTPLQSNFGAILLALDNGQPRQIPLRELLQAFLNFREETLIRQYRHDLAEAENRLHIVAGLLTALSNLDEVIDILRRSADGATARVALQERFELSDAQANAILAMPLRRLTNLEQQNLQTEDDELTQRIAQLQRLLADRRELLKALKKDLRALKRKFKDPRRTRIQSEKERAAESKMLAEIVAEEKEEETILEFSDKGYVRRSSPRAFQRRQARQEGENNQTLQESDDFIVQVEEAITTQELLTLTRDGKAFTLKIGDIPQTQRQSKGTPLVSLLPGSVPVDPDGVIAQIVLSESALERDLILLTQEGRVKRTPLEEFQHLTGRGLSALKLKAGDELRYIVIANPGDQLILATSGGRLLRFEINDEQIPVMGRTAQGPKAIRLRRQESLAGCVALGGQDNLLLVSAMGYAKRMPVAVLRLANRGEIGTQAFRFSAKSDALAAMIAATPHTQMAISTSADRVAHIPIDAVPRQGKDTLCHRLLKPNRGEQIIAIAVSAIQAEKSDNSDA